MDRIDRHILKILQQEGRISTAEISERVGLSPSPCARRIKCLEDDGFISSYQANLNKDKVGIAMTFFVEVRLQSHQEECIKEFEDALFDMEEVINGHIVSGAYDYLLEVISADLAGYETFTKKLHKITSVKDIHTHLSVRQVIAKRALPIYLKNK
ncbi:Lrp/AsnC family transcriptional regulator [Psychromonas sp. KJ10-10]|uniref:Lrp/AsnC family transcriptional regulator n=1 Tax=Psychromonas sp. KJ10-10 TaxID=3391823 RepID=UPI0039B410CD